MVSEKIETTINKTPEAIGAIIIGGTFQALGVIRSLGRQKVPVCLLDYDFGVAKFSRYTKQFLSCPPIRQETRFFQFLTDLAVHKNMMGWIIYPDNDEVVNFLAKHRRHLTRFFRVPTPDWEITRLASEKKLTYQLASKIGISIPETRYPRDMEELKRWKVDFPVILKPSVKEPFYSLTKKKAIRADNRDQLYQEFYKAKRACPEAEMMLQELIPGAPVNLYSVGSFFKGNDMVGKVVARRLRQHPMDFGHATTYAVTVDIPELEHIARRLLRAMGYYGLSEIEFMQDPRDGRYKLIEMNPRPWGWHTLAIQAGVNLPYLLYQDVLGQRTLANEFVTNTKWVHLLTDLPTVLQEMLHRRLSLKEYFKSIKGLKYDAVLSLNDPLPFVMELLMAPYLRIKRGF